MSATPIISPEQITITYRNPADRNPADRAATNRANSQHSTGPRTEAGKQRSSQNALRHGLTAASPVLPSEDPAAYQDHRRRFFDEYQPATPTESQLVQELADTSWRLNRIPLLEAEVLARAAAPVPLDQESPSTSSTPIVSSPTSASRAIASPAISRKASKCSARSKPTAPTANAATSTMPPPCSNSTSTKEFPGNPPIMASFFQKTK
jgi:hypothetical protein